MRRALLALVALSAITCYCAPVRSVAATTPPACQIANDATPTLQAELNEGGTLNGHDATYEIDNLGLHVTVPVKVENATFVEPEPSHCTDANGKVVLPQPVFTVGDISDVTFDDVTITGTHKGGRLYYGSVAEEGIRIDGTTDYTIENVTASHLWGDGVDIAPSTVPGDWHCARTGVIENLTAWNDNRDGISPTCEEGLAVTGASFANEGQAPVDFEADFKGPHADDVTMTSLSAGSVVMEEPGNVDVSLWDGSGHATAISVYTKVSNPAPSFLQVDDSNIGCGQVPTGCVYNRGVQGMIDLRDDTITSGDLSDKAPARPVIEMYGGVAHVDHVTVTTAGGKPWKNPVCGPNAHVYVRRSSFTGC